jgi:hypothetical protein
LAIEFRVRRLDGSTTHVARAPIAVQFQLAPFIGNTFFVGDNEIFVLSGDLVRGQSAAVPTSDAMHTYRILVNGSSFAVHRDGIPTLSGTMFSNPNFQPSKGILWGEASSLAHGTSDWEFFEYAESLVDCSVASSTNETADFGPGLTSWPNPMPGSSVVAFSLAESMETDLSVYDVTGKLVRRLASQRLPMGQHRFTWDGRNTSGEPVAAGVYFHRLTTPNRQITSKVVVAR